MKVEAQNVILQIIIFLIQFWKPNACTYIITQIHMKLRSQQTISKIPRQPQTTLKCFFFIGLAYQGKDIVFQIHYRVQQLLKGFFLAPQVIIGLFLYEDFLNIIFQPMLKLEISLQSYNIVKDFWFLLEKNLKIIFWHGEIFEFS